MKTEEYIHELREYFEKRSDVVMAFVFGSQAKERGHSGSDWDIAVYFTPISEILEWEEENREYPEEDRIWNDCIDILKTDNVDLVVLNRAPATVADAAIRGIPLVIKDRALFLRFMLVVSQEAEDYCQFIDEYFAIHQRSGSLTPQDRGNLERIRTAKRLTKEDVPLYVGVMDTSTSRVKENIKIAEDEEARQGNIDKVKELQRKASKLRMTCFASGFWLSGLKYTCSVLGFCEEYVSPSFPHLTGSQKEKVRNIPKEEGLLGKD